MLRDGGFFFLVACFSAVPRSTCGCCDSESQRSSDESDKPRGGSSFPGFYIYAAGRCGFVARTKHMKMQECPHLGIGGRSGTLHCNSSADADLWRSSYDGNDD